MHCFLEAADSDCVIDQLKPDPGLKSLAKYFSGIVKADYHDSRMCLRMHVHNMLHTQMTISSASVQSSMVPLHLAVGMGDDV